MVAQLIERAQAVRTRMQEVRADTLVSSIALRSFLSFIPLLAVAIAVLGFVAQSDADLTNRMIKTLKLSGDLADTFESNVEAATRSRRSTSVFGVLLLAWTSSGLFAVIAQACDAVWQVPTRGLKDKAAGLLWSLGAVVLLGAVAGGVTIIQVVHLPFIGLITSLAVGFVAGTGLFWWTQRVFTNVNVPTSAFVPGALVGGVAFAVFQVVGSYLVPSLIASASVLYKSLASVVALLAFLVIIARLLVVSSVVSVVWWEEAHGTVSLMVHAPAIPGGSWAVAERAGQRPAPKNPSKVIAALKTVTSRYARRR